MAPLPVAEYAPWGNAQLTFRVGTGVYVPEPATGNAIETKTPLEYLASVTPASGDWTAAPGSDTTVWQLQGRLLSPSVLDPRITNGSEAEALINGVRGRFLLTTDMRMDAAHRRDLRQSISGTFRVTGGPS